MAPQTGRGKQRHRMLIQDKLFSAVNTGKLITNHTVFCEVGSDKTNSVEKRGNTKEEIKFDKKDLC